MEERHREERKELLQRHSDETGIENLWFDMRIKSPEYAKQDAERMALMRKHKKEIEQKRLNR